MKRYIIILLTACACTLPATAQKKTAQKKSPHTLTANLGGGLSTLQYSPEIGQFQPGFGGLFSLEYSYALRDRWAIRTGLELSLYHAKTTQDMISGSDTGEDPLSAGDTYTLNYTYRSFEEKQQILSLNIPLMMEFRPVPGYYLAGGFKIGFPLNSSYKTTADNLTTTGSFSYEGRTYSGLEYGFGSYDNFSVKKDLDPAIAYMLSLEFGKNWNVGGKPKVRTSLYADYGLNNIQQTETATLIHYRIEGPEYLEFNSITSGADKVVPLAVGLKIGWVF